MAVKQVMIPPEVEEAYKVLRDWEAQRKVEAGKEREERLKKHYEQIMAALDRDDINAVYYTPEDGGGYPVFKETHRVLSVSTEGFPKSMVTSIRNKINEKFCAEDIEVDL